MPIFGHGHEIVTSTTRPSGPYTGQIIYETDTFSYRWWSGTSWEGVVPIGATQTFAGAAAPAGWLFCFGQTLNASTNPEYAPLYSVIANLYGGTNNTNFQVPDLRGRVVAGKDDMGGTAINRLTVGVSGVNGALLNGSGGSQSLQGHTHTYSGTTGTDSPDHSHNVYFRYIDYYGTANYSPAGNSGQFGFGSGVQSGGASARHTHTYSGTTADNGSGGTSQNVQPTLILNYIIKY